MRAVTQPYALLGRISRSLSPGVEDPGVHRFDLDGRPLHVGDAFFLCVGAIATRGETDAFLHLPLTDGLGLTGGSASGGVALTPGEATRLLVVEGRPGIPAGSSSGLDPWQNHTLALRVEFVEAAAQTTESGARGTEVGGFSMRGSAQASGR